MSSSLVQSLQNAAGRNRELLACLQETDYAPTALKQNASYIADLGTQIKKTDAELKRLHTITEDERKDHVKYQESTFKRYAHKFGGKKGQAKFVSKQEKEEREFMEAWQKERETQESRAEMNRALETAKKDKENLEHAKTRHDQAQAELDQMYSSIFSGPTPDVPGEDQMEATVQNCKQYLDGVQSQYNLDKQAYEAMQRVTQSMQRAAKDMQDALSASTWDMWGGGTFSDMMERDALSRAQVSVTESLRHMDEARRCQPAIAQLQDINIDHGHMISDVLFDNIFTDMAQHDRIKTSNAQIQKALAQSQTQLEEQKQRALSAKSQASQANSDMNSAREELQRVRAEAFDRFAGNGGYGNGGFGNVGYDNAGYGNGEYNAGYGNGEYNDAPPPQYSQGGGMTAPLY